MKKRCEANSQVTLNRREFSSILAGMAALPVAGMSTAEPSPILAPEKKPARPVTASTAKPPTQSLPTFEKLTDGSLQWTLSNPLIVQTLSLRTDRFSCSSLLNRNTGSQWIHPTEVSDEFLIHVTATDGHDLVLTGSGGWTYLEHRVVANSQGWSELKVTLKHVHQPVEIIRHYLWHNQLPVIRQHTSLKNAGTERLTVKRLDTFRLRVCPVPDALELSWMNNFGRGMMPNPGNPIHYRSVDENVDHAVRTGPYSPDCGWFSLQIPHQGEGLVGGWEFSSPMVIHFGDLNDPCLISGGLDPEGMGETVDPGSSLEGPVGWYGFYDGNLDAAAALSHDLIRESLGPPLPEKDYPWLGYSSWSASLDEDSPFNEKGTHPWFPTQANLLSQVEAAAELGFDLFSWDYGWFPRIGDWWCDPRRLPNGPRPVVEAVKKHGMRLGLWIGFGNADDTSQVVLQHPDWLATYGGKPIPDKFFTRTAASVWNTRVLCLAHQPTREWVKQQLARVINEFELDWLKHDFDLITVCTDTHHTHTPGDGRIAACEGFYEIMDFVRQRFPQLVCEHWLNNSAVPDYGVLQRHHMQLIGDAYQAFLLRQMVYGHTQIFPVDRQNRYLRCDDSVGEFKTMIRSGLLGGPCILLSDPRRMDTSQRETLKSELHQYKRFRHLMRGCRCFRLLGRPHPRGWDAFEILHPLKDEGLVYVFRNNHPLNRQRVQFAGIHERQSYHVEFLDSRQSSTMSGQELMTIGISVDLPHPNSTELLHFARTGKAGA